MKNGMQKPGLTKSLSVAGGESVPKGCRALSDPFGASSPRGGAEAHIMQPRHLLLASSSGGEPRRTSSQWPVREAEVNPRVFATRETLGLKSETSTGTGR